MELIDKAAVVAEIEKNLNSCKPYSTEYVNGKKYALKSILSFIDTLEVKEVVAEQECTCNEVLNRIVGSSWNLLCPVNKLGLKTNDKVDIVISKAQKGE